MMRRGGGDGDWEGRGPGVGQGVRRAGCGVRSFRRRVRPSKAMSKEGGSPRQRGQAEVEGDSSRGLGV